MKLPIYASGMFCLALASATPSLAQESEKANIALKLPKFVVGGKIGISNSYDAYKNVADVNLESSIFFRHYLGKHLALETGLDHGYGTTRNHINSWTGTSRPVLTTNVFTVPVHLQYHYGKREQAIRPYLGIGIGIQRRFYSERFTYHNDEFVRNQDRNDVILQLTQGLTWQVSKRLQINEALYYRHGTFPHVGFQIGAGYTFLK